MKKPYWACITLLLLLTTSLYASELKIYTEEMPPYNYMDESSGKASGFSVEIVKEMLRRTGISATGGEINVYPWARAYEIVQNENNVMLFSMTKTEARKDLFKWVGPIAHRTVWLWKLKERNEIVVNSLEDAKHYTIGGVRKFSISEYLVKQGYKVDMAGSIESNWRKLFSHRIDLGTALDIEAAYYAKKLSKSFKQLEKLVVVDNRYDFYLAFNKKTSDHIIDQLQKALDQMKEDGSYEKIRQMYLK